MHRTVENHRLNEIGFNLLYRPYDSKGQKRKNRIAQGTDNSNQNQTERRPHIGKQVQ